MPDSAEEHVSCRICMDPKDSYVSLFSHNLSMKVMEVADVQVEKDDGLPSSICTECEQDLEKCYEFRLKVQVSDKKLRENIKLTQVDIVECNIKEERYMDDGDSDNLEDKDSGSMDDEHYDDEPDVAPRISEETEEAEPDPLNHVVVVEENERKMEMTEEPSTQDDMVEEPQVQKIEEVALDPLVCMKQEAETEIMDVDSNMPDPFGPSSSVTTTELQYFNASSTMKANKTNKEMKKDPLQSSEGNQELQGPILGKKQKMYIPVSKLKSCVSHGSISNTENMSSPFPLQGGSVHGHFIAGRSFSATQLQVGSTVDHLNAEQSFPTSSVQGCSAQDYYNIQNTLLPTTAVFVSQLAFSVQKEPISLSPSNTICQINSEHMANISRVNIQDINTGAANTCKQKSSIHQINTNSRVKLTNSKNFTTIVAEEKTCDTSINQESFTLKPENKNTSLSDVKQTCETVSDSRSSKSSVQNSEEVGQHSNECFCVVCNVYFGSPDLLEDHTTGRKEFVCRACTAIFNNHKELETHFFTHRKISCKVCKQVFYVKKDLYIHRKSVSKCKKPELLKCNFCSYTFVHRKNFEIHMNQKHGNGDFQKVTCQICSSSLKNQQILISHLRFTHPAYENMECDICHSILLGPEKLKLHIKTKHIQAAPESCPICKKVMSSAPALKNHLETHNILETICEVCGATVKGKGANYRNHMKLHENKIFNCRTCLQTFNSYIDRRKHSAKEHKKKSDEKHSICEICGKEYKSKYILKNHMAIHSEEKPYVCEVCGAAFKARVTLRTHSRIHSNVTKYSCNNCGEGFKWKQTFDKHVLNCESSQNEDMNLEAESN